MALSKIGKFQEAWKKGKVVVKVTPTSKKSGRGKSRYYRTGKDDATEITTKSAEEAIAAQTVASQAKAELAAKEQYLAEQKVSVAQQLTRTTPTAQATKTPDIIRQQHLTTSQQERLLKGEGTPSQQRVNYIPESVKQAKELQTRESSRLERFRQQIEMQLTPQEIKAAEFTKGFVEEPYNIAVGAFKLSTVGVGQDVKTILTPKEYTLPSGVTYSSFEPAKRTKEVIIKKVTDPRVQSAAFIGATLGFGAVGVGAKVGASVLRVAQPAIAAYGGYETYKGFTTGDYERAGRGAFFVATVTPSVISGARKVSSAISQVQKRQALKGKLILSGERLPAETTKGLSTQIKVKPIEAVVYGGRSKTGFGLKTQVVKTKPIYGKERFITTKEISELRKVKGYRTQRTSEIRLAPTSKGVDPTRQALTSVEPRVSYAKTITRDVSKQQLEPLLSKRTGVGIYSDKTKSFGLETKQAGVIKFQALKYEKPSVEVNVFWNQLSMKQKKLYTTGVEYKGGIGYSTKAIGYTKQSDYIYAKFSLKGKTREIKIDPTTGHVVGETTIANVKPLVVTKVNNGGYAAAVQRTMNIIRPSPTATVGVGSGLIQQTVTKQETVTAQKLSQLQKQKTKSEQKTQYELGSKQETSTLSKQSQQQQSVFKQETVIKLKQVSKPKPLKESLLSASKTKLKIIALTRTSTRSKGRSKSVSEGQLKSITDTAQKPISITDTTQKPISATDTISESISITTQKPSLRTSYGLPREYKPSSITRTTKQSKPSKIGLPKLKLKSGSGSFGLLVRRKGKFEKIGTYDYSKAFAKGKAIVKRTAAASFKIVSQRGELGTPQPLGAEFRKSKKEKDVFIQKRRYRISSLGELRDITYKGIRSKGRT